MEQLGGLNRTIAKKYSLKKNKLYQNEITNKQTLRQKNRTYIKSPSSLVILVGVCIATLITVMIMGLLIGYILLKGIPYLNISLFKWHYTSENLSMMPAIINTLMMTGVALSIAVPLGIGTAIYLVEYATKGSRFVKIIRVTNETLAGIPSIIYGLFGMLFFVTKLGWHYSILSGACTVAIMVLPTIMRTSEEALLAVPDSYREGSYGLGAGKLRTVFRIVLPSAVPGILSGVILATGRIVGETAALMYTAGTVADASGDLMASGRTLAIHMYSLSREGLHINEAYATAVVLLVLVAGINGFSVFLAKRIVKG